MTDAKLNYETRLQNFLTTIEEEWRQGRLEEDDEVAEFLGRMLRRSRRDGFASGEPARSFHLHVRSFKVTAPRRLAARGSAERRPASLAKGKSTANRDALRRRISAKLAYVQRTDAHAFRSDLVSLGGVHAEGVQAFTMALAEGSARANANLLYEITMELPQEAGVGPWMQTGDELVRLFTDRGCPATYAIHDPGNPHIHLLVAARPCREISPGYWVAEAQGRIGCPGFRLFDGRAAIYRFRTEAADLVNDICRPVVQFHPGRRAATGLGGAPERRMGFSELRRYHNEMKWLMLERVSRLRNERQLERLRGIVKAEDPARKPALPSHPTPEMIQPDILVSREPGLPPKPVEPVGIRGLSSELAPGKFPLRRMLPNRPEPLMGNSPSLLSRPESKVPRQGRLVEPDVSGVRPVRSAPSERPNNSGRPERRSDPGKQSADPYLDGLLAAAEEIWFRPGLESEARYQQRLRTMPPARLANLVQDTTRLLELFVRDATDRTDEFRRALDELRTSRRLARKILAERQPTSPPPDQPGLPTRPGTAKRPRGFER